jgi:hypothetical protein
MNDNGEHRAHFDPEMVALARWDGERGVMSRAPRLAAPWNARLRRPRPGDPARDAFHGAHILSSRCREPE